MPDAADENPVVFEVFGEGKTDVGGESSISRLPDEGVVPILVHRICGMPSVMRVKTKTYAHLQGKGLWQKVRFSNRQAFYNGTHGAVFVVDTEGNDKTISELIKGRDHELPDFPMAVGAPRPCIESWLLADSSAVRRSLGSSCSTALPEDPESLPAPCIDRRHNPKTVLAEQGVDSQRQKDSIARNLDITMVCDRCLLSFKPFVVEVETHLRPLLPKAETLARNQ